MNSKNLLLSPDGTAGAGAGAGTAEAGAGTGDELDVTEQPGAAPNDGGTGVPGADGGSAPPAKTEAGEEPGGEGEGEPEAGEGEPAAAATGLTREDIQEILKNVIPNVQPQQQPQPEQQPQLSEADYERLFNVYKPDANLITLLRSEDPATALKALTQLRDGLIRQAMTMAEYRMQQYRDTLVNEHIAPLQSFVTEQQATSFRNDFFKQYPDLEPYETIVDAVAAKLQAAGWNGKDRKEVMKRFAEDTKQVVQTLMKAKPSAGGNGKGTPTGGAAPATRKMPNLSGGGQGGQSRPGATPGAGSSKGPRGIEVFD